jgi:ketosteroid isomerase-like protein
MKKSFVKYLIMLPLLLMISFSLSCGKEKGVKTVNEQADITAINHILDTYAQSVNTDDLEQWMSNWDDEGIRLPPDKPAAFGKEEIQQQVEIVFQQGGAEMAIDIVDIKVSGDWAFSVASFAVAVSTPEGTLNLVGKALTQFKRQKNGSWKIYCDCFNYDGPPTK